MLFHQLFKDIYDPSKPTVRLLYDKDQMSQLDVKADLSVALLNSTAVITVTYIP